MQNVVSAHAVLTRRKGRILVRITCSGHVLWRTYPSAIGEGEAVRRASQHLAKSKSTQETNTSGNTDIIHCAPPLQIAWWRWLT